MLASPILPPIASAPQSQATTCDIPGAAIQPSISLFIHVGTPAPNQAPPPCQKPPAEKNEIIASCSSSVRPPEEHDGWIRAMLNKITSSSRYPTAASAVQILRALRTPLPADVRTRMDATLCGPTAERGRAVKHDKERWKKKPAGCNERKRSE